jgi:cytochrome c biogenesis protein
MIAGCVITFFMSHQQICIEAHSDGNIGSVMIRGIANKNKIGIQNKVDAIAEAVSQAENQS